MTYSKRTIWAKLSIALITSIFLLSSFNPVIGSETQPINSPFADETDIYITENNISLSTANPMVGVPLTITADVQGDKTIMRTEIKETRLFNENFNDGNNAGWRLSNWNPTGTSEITNDEFHSSPYSWHAQSDFGENTGPWMGKVLDDEYSIIRVETYFQLPTKTQVYEGFQILRLASVTPDWVDTGRGITTDSNFIIALMDDDYSIDITEYYDETGVPGLTIHHQDAFTLNPNQWYKISCEINGTDYSVEIDDVPLVSGQRNDDTPIDWIILGDTGSTSGSGDGYWDDISVYADIEVPIYDYYEVKTISENFDDGDNDGWKQSNWNPTGVSEVTNSVSNSASYSWHVQSDSTENTGPWIARDLENEYSAFRIDTYFQVPTKTQTYNNINIMRLASVVPGWTDASSNLATDSNFIISLMDDDYSIDVVEGYDNAGTWTNTIHHQDASTLNPNQWYNISCEIIGYDYNVWIDNSLVASGQRNDDAGIEWLMLGDAGGLTGYGDAYWDDITLYPYVGTPATSHIGMDAVCDVSFYDGVTLIETVSDVSIPENTETPVTIDWTPAIAGQHDITVTLSSVVPTDTNLTNNSASASFLVLTSTIVNEDFDDGDSDGWKQTSWNPTGTSEATNAVSNSASYSWHLQSDPLENTGPWIAKNLSGEYSALRVETYFQLPTKAQTYDGLQILRLASVPSDWVDNGRGITTDSNFIIALMDDDYSIDITEYYDETGVPGLTVHHQDIFDLNPNQWYKITCEINGIDYKVWVDDVLLVSGQRDNNLGIEWVLFGDTGGSTGYGDAYWDDIAVHV